jgi:hypothetical protein
VRIAFPIPTRHETCRRVDWRFRRCRDLVDLGQRPSRRLDDRMTWRAWECFLAMARGTNKQRRELVQQHWPDIAAAVELRQSTDGFKRWTIEGRILARESFDIVAAKTGVATDTLEAYLGVFFDVTRHLHAKDWIANEVLFASGRDIAEDDAETLLKQFGYFGGSFVLDSLVSYFTSPEPIPDDISLVPADRRQRAILDLRIKAALLAQSSPFGDPRPEKYALLADRLQALHQEAKDADGMDQEQPVNNEPDKDKEATYWAQMRRAG